MKLLPDVEALHAASNHDNGVFKDLMLHDVPEESEHWAWELIGDESRHVEVLDPEVMLRLPEEFPPDGIKQYLQVFSDIAEWARLETVCSKDGKNRYYYDRAMMTHCMNIGHQIITNKDKYVRTVGDYHFRSQRGFFGWTGRYPTLDDKEWRLAFLKVGGPMKYVMQKFRVIPEVRGDLPEIRTEVGLLPPVDWNYDAYHARRLLSPLLEEG